MFCNSTRREVVKRAVERLCFIGKQFHPHATDLDFYFIFFGHVLVFIFQTTVPMTKKGHLNCITYQQLHLFP